MRQFKIGDKVTVSHERYNKALKTPTDYWNELAIQYYGNTMTVFHVVENFSIRAGYSEHRCHGWSPDSLTFANTNTLPDELFTL